MDEDRDKWLESRLRPDHFEWPGEGSSVAAARLRFLDAVRRVEPKVLKHLGRTPFAQFRPVAELAFPGSSSAVPMETELDPFDAALAWRRLERASARDWRLVPLCDALRIWGEQWNLSDPWCLEAALWTLWAWSTPPEEDPNRSNWHVPWGTERGDWPPLSEDETLIRFEHPGWVFPWESRREVRKRIVKVFEAHLDATLDRTESLFEERGMVRSTDKRKLERMAWLAKYQVTRMDYPRLVDEISEGDWDGGPTDRAVRLAVADLAGFIGLSLREPDPSGRPPAGTIAPPKRPAPRVVVAKRLHQRPDH